MEDETPNYSDEVLKFCGMNSRIEIEYMTENTIINIFSKYYLKGQK